jgi:hypothetical protein
MSKPYAALPTTLHDELLSLLARFELAQNTYQAMCTARKIPSQEVLKRRTVSKDIVQKAKVMAVECSKTRSVAGAAMLSPAQISQEQKLSEIIASASKEVEKFSGCMTGE